MKINIILKDEQKEFLDQVMNGYSLKNMETAIQSLEVSLGAFFVFRVWINSVLIE